MDILGRSYTSITSGSWRGKLVLPIQLQKLMKTLNSDKFKAVYFEFTLLLNVYTEKRIVLNVTIKMKTGHTW